MPPQPSTDLRIFVLSVGQGDTSVIVTPGGNVVVIDAKFPGKIENLFNQLHLNHDDPISLLVITHPHLDHHSGANFLLQNYAVEQVALSPFWCGEGLGSPTYRGIVGRIDEGRIPVHFAAGYGRVYPDRAAVRTGSTSGDWIEGGPYVELIGPSNAIIGQLERSRDLDTNHMSVMARLTWGDFRMVFAADAQMENWAHYDREEMLEEPCEVLKTAHHGSANGTQWERINRLGRGSGTSYVPPRCVIVSSDPEGRHHLPDLVGAAVFAKLESENARDSVRPKRIVALTRRTGTIQIVVRPTGTFDTFRYDEDPDDETINLQQPLSLLWNNNPTDWAALLKTRIEDIYGPLCPAAPPNP